MFVWLTVVLLLTGLYLYWAIRFDPAEALGVAIPAAWLFPAWILLPFFYSPNSIVATGLDVKVAVTSICLILYCFIPGRRFPVKFVLSDYAMLTLFVVHHCSDALNDEWKWTVPARACAEWYLPYIAGRVCLQSAGTIRRLWAFWAAIGIVLGLAAIIEGVTRVNPFELVFGIRPYEGASHDHVRWGLRRAYGVTLNPIYFGSIQVLLLGWIAYAAFRSLKKEIHWAWAFAPAVALLGIICTGSRGPIFGVGFLAVGIVYFMAARYRLLLWGTAGVLTLTMAFFASPILNALDQWTGESKRARIVMIDGHEHVLTNVRARLLLFEVNKIAFQRSGLLGFGTESVSGFPVNVPVGGVEAETLRKVWTIENTYALLLLRFGYLGLGAFVAAALLSLFQYQRIADRYQDTDLHWFAGTVGAATFATLIVQGSVWMPHEIGFPLVYFFGLSAGLAYADRNGDLEDENLEEDED